MLSTDVNETVTVQPHIVHLINIILMFTGWTACFLPRTLSRAFPHFCRIIHHSRNYRRPRVHKSTTCAAFGHSTQIWSSLTFSYRVASWWLTRHPRMTRPSLTSLTSVAVPHTSNLLEHKSFSSEFTLSRLVLYTYTSFSHKYWWIFVF